MSSDLRFFFYLIMLAFVSTTILASNVTRLPQYQDFPVTEIYQSQTAKLNFANNRYKAFHQVLKRAAKQPPNFAGHYILTSWGCSTFCRTLAIIDAQNGNIYFPEINKDIDTNKMRSFGWTYEPPQLNSKLLIVLAQYAKDPKQRNVQFDKNLI